MVTFQLNILGGPHNGHSEVSMPVVPRKGEGIFFAADDGSSRITVGDVSYHQASDGSWTISVTAIPA